MGSVLHENSEYATIYSIQMVTEATAKVVFLYGKPDAEKRPQTTITIPISDVPFWGTRIGKRVLVKRTVEVSE